MKTVMPIILFNFLSTFIWFYISIVRLPVVGTIGCILIQSSHCSSKYSTRSPSTFYSPCMLLNQPKLFTICGPFLTNRRTRGSILKTWSMWSYSPRCCLCIGSSASLVWLFLSAENCPPPYFLPTVFTFISLGFYFWGRNRLSYS